MSEERGWCRWIVDGGRARGAKGEVEKAASVIKESRPETWLALAEDVKEHSAYATSSTSRLPIENRRIGEIRQKKMLDEDRAVRHQCF